jgi:HTH-like domain
LRREVERLRMEREILKKPSPSSGKYEFKLPEVRFAFIHANRTKWPVRLMCQVLGMSASGYYAWRERSECRRAKANHALLEDIRLVHAQSSGCYGAPRVHTVLRRRGRCSRICD